MTALEIMGAPWGNFVRTARMACHEKGVAYTLTVERPQSPAVKAIHPFGLVPCLRHGGLTLCESRAICAYIDQAFDGPPLVPRDAVPAAVTEQWIALVMTSIDPVLARQYLVAYLRAPDGVPDRAAIDALLPRMHAVFVMLDDAMATRSHVAGDSFTLADMFLFPLIWFMRLKPESAAMLRGSAHLMRWYDRIAARPSARETEPPQAPAPV